MALPNSDNPVPSMSAEIFDVLMFCLGIIGVFAIFAVAILS